MTATQAPEIAEESEEKLAAMTVEVERYKTAAVDAVVDTRRLKMVPVTRDENTPASDRVAIVAATPQGSLGIAVNDGAHRQIADRLKIDWRYYERLLKGAPELLAQNVNWWFEREPERRLVRMFNPITAGDERRFARYAEADLHGPEFPVVRTAARAFLSASYRPVDHGSLLNVVLPEVRARGAILREWNLTDTRFHARFLTVDRDAAEVVRALRERDPVKYGGGHVMIHEVLRQGLELRNSETGHAAYDVRAIIEILRCTNQAIGPGNLRGFHLGEKKEEGYIANDTQRLQNATLFLKVRDKAIEILSEKQLEEMAVSVLKAHGTVIEPEIPLLEFVGNVGARFELTDAEVAVLKEEVSADQIDAAVRFPNSEPRRLTQMNLSQGFTAIAKAADSFERRTELQELGFKILTDPLQDLLRAGRSKN